MTQSPEGSDSGRAPVRPAQGAAPVEASGAATSPVFSTSSGTSAADDTGGVRQPVVRVRGARRARLLPAPGTTTEPAPSDDPARGAASRPTASGPNDERMLREVPPHY